MSKPLSVLHEEILKLLKAKQTSYAQPLTSNEIGQLLNVSPSYIREQMQTLQIGSLVKVRNGRGGGYFLNLGE